MNVLHEGTYTDVPQEENWWLVDPAMMSDSSEEMGSDEDIISKFRQRADGHELDYYTCLSLSLAEEPNSGCLSMRSWIQLRTRLPVLVALQIVVPLFLATFDNAFSLYSGNTDIKFRGVGFILYLYSVRVIHDNSDDECRTLFLRIAHQHRLPTRYLFPAFLGEFINTFCGFVLVYTLFKVYVLSPDPFALVINCMGVNYLGNVDNDFADACRDDAIRDFEDLVHGIKPLEISSKDKSHCCYDCFFVVTTKILQIIRLFGILIFGQLLGLIFLFAAEPFPCSFVKLPEICKD